MHELRIVFVNTTLHALFAFLLHIVRVHSFARVSCFALLQVVSAAVHSNGTLPPHRLPCPNSGASAGGFLSSFSPTATNVVVVVVVQVPSSK